VGGKTLCSRDNTGTQNQMVTCTVISRKVRYAWSEMKQVGCESTNKQERYLIRGEWQLTESAETYRAQPLESICKLRQ